MEAQLLYFTCAPHFDQWRFKAVPISKTYLDSIPPASPPNLSGLNGLIDAIGKLCAYGGEMAGWRLHMLEASSPKGPYGYNCAKIILTRTPDGHLEIKKGLTGRTIKGA